MFFPIVNVVKCWRLLIVVSVNSIRPLLLLALAVNRLNGGIVVSTVLRVWPYGHQIAAPSGPQHPATVAMPFVLPYATLHPQHHLLYHILPSSRHIHLGEDDVGEVEETGEGVRVRALSLVRESDAHGREPKPVNVIVSVSSCRQQ